MQGLTANKLRGIVQVHLLFAYVHMHAHTTWPWCNLLPALTTLTLCPRVVLFAAGWVQTCLDEVTTAARAAAAAPGLGPGPGGGDWLGADALTARQVPHISKPVSSPYLAPI